MKFLLESRIGVENRDAELEDSWLNLKDISSLELDYNPMLDSINNEIFEKNPGLFEIYTLRRPEYLSYFAMLALETA